MVEPISKWNKRIYIKLYKNGIMYDPHPDEIREFIATIILSAAHDNSLVDAAFKWIASRK